MKKYCIVLCLSFVSYSSMPAEDIDHIVSNIQEARKQVEIKTQQFDNYYKSVITLMKEIESKFDAARKNAESIGVEINTLTTEVNTAVEEINKDFHWNKKPIIAVNEKKDLWEIDKVFQEFFYGKYLAAKKLRTRATKLGQELLQIYGSYGGFAELVSDDYNQKFRGAIRNYYQAQEACYEKAGQIEDIVFSVDKVLQQVIFAIATWEAKNTSQVQEKKFCQVRHYVNSLIAYNQAKRIINARLREIVRQFRWENLDQSSLIVPENQAISIVADYQQYFTNNTSSSVLCSMSGKEDGGGKESSGSKSSDKNSGDEKEIKTPDSKEHKSQESNTPSSKDPEFIEKQNGDGSSTLSDKNDKNYGPTSPPCLKNKNYINSEGRSVIVIDCARNWPCAKLPPCPVTGPTPQSPNLSNKDLSINSLADSSQPAYVPQPGETFSGSGSPSKNGPSNPGKDSDKLGDSSSKSESGSPLTLDSKAAHNDAAACDRGAQDIRREYGNNAAAERVAREQERMKEVLSGLGNTIDDGKKNVLKQIETFNKDIFPPSESLVSVTSAFPPVGQVINFSAQSAAKNIAKDIAKDFVKGFAREDFAKGLASALSGIKDGVKYANKPVATIISQSFKYAAHKNGRYVFQVGVSKALKTFTARSVFQFKRTASAKMIAIKGGPFGSYIAGAILVYDAYSIADNAIELGKRTVEAYRENATSNRAFQDASNQALASDDWSGVDPNDKGIVVNTIMASFFTSQSARLKTTLAVFSTVGLPPVNEQPPDAFADAFGPINVNDSALSQEQRIKLYEALIQAFETEAEDAEKSAREFLEKKLKKGSIPVIEIPHPRVSFSLPE